MYTISKEFELDWSHRIRNQSFDYSLTEKPNQPRLCLHPHGHTGKFIVTLKSHELAKDMVLDYNEIGFVKTLISKYLDHHSIYAQDDPIVTSIILPQISALYEKVVEKVELEPIEDLSVREFQVYKVVVDSQHQNGDNPFYQWLDGLLISSFNTTSECLARWMFELVKRKIDQYNEAHPEVPDVKVASVAYKETPKSTCVYTPDEE